MIQNTKHQESGENSLPNLVKLTEYLNATGHPREILRVMLALLGEKRGEYKDD